MNTSPGPAAANHHKGSAAHGLEACDVLLEQPLEARPIIATSRPTAGLARTSLPTTAGAEVVFLLEFAPNSQPTS